MLRDRQLIDDANWLSIEILKTDAELALTFTSVAQNLKNEQAAVESVHRARTAYDYISGKRNEVVISEADAIEIDTKLAKLRKRLQDLGERF